MKISSKFKKIISFMLVAVLAISAVVLPVSAEETTTEETEKYTPMYDLSNAYFTDSADLEYTGVRSDNLTLKFNVRQEYDMSFTMQDYYFCKPFNLTTCDGRDPVTMFTGDKSSYGDMFSLSYLQTATASFFEKNNLSLTNYDVYYYACTGRKQNSGIFDMYYYLVPKGRRIAITNAWGPQFDNGAGVWGIYSKSSSFACLNNNDASMSIVYVHRRIDAYYNEITDDVNFVTTCTPPNAFVKDEAYYYKFIDNSFITGLYQQEAVCSNIPVFRSVEDTGLYVNEIRDPVADNKAPVEEQKPADDYNDRKISSDAFGWNSFDCSLVQDGDSYKFIYKYDPSSNDMKNNPSNYYFTCEYSQNVKYKVVGQTNDLYKSKSSTLSKDNYIDSGGTTINRFNEMGIKVYDGSDDGTSGSWFRFALYNLLGSDEIQGSANILSSYLYVTVTLHHTYVNTSSQSLSGVNKVLKDTSSDVRHFKYDALTGERVDASDVVSNVITRDVTDEKGNTVKEVTQITTNDNSTHDTINNYYYDSNGNKSNSSTGSSVLSDILSELIKFIKTLVTEGLPAALEILKTLISSLTGIVSDALNNIDIGTGTTNGILAVFKALPPAMWSLLLIGIVVLVVVGIINRIF